MTCIERVPTEGGPAVRLRCEAANMAVSSDGSTIDFAPQLSRPGEIRKAQPENGSSQPFAYVAPSRIPFVPQGYALSPDDHNHQYLGDTHGRWSHASVHRFRTAPDLNRPPGFVVAGRQIHLRGSRRDRRGHRVTRRIAAMNPEKADTEQASLVPDDKGSEMKVARVFFYRI